jgi:translocation and assembly module TamB
MRISTKLAKRLGIGAAVVLAGVVVIRAWVVPAVIRSRLQGMVEGRVTFRGWWFNGRSAGLVGVTLHEGRGVHSPIFASAGRVTTDLSLRGLLRGRISPGRIILDDPRVTFRLDRDSRFLNLPALRGGGRGSSLLPSIEVHNAELVFRTEGRPEMDVRAINARLGAGEKAILSGRTDDPAWGPWEVSGSIDPTFGSGSVALFTKRFAADLEKLSRVPFVSEDVWSHFLPRGPVGVDVTLQWGGEPTIKTRAVVTLRDTVADFPSLGLSTTDTTGRLVIEDGVIHAEQVKGRSIGGTVTTQGTLNLGREPPKNGPGLREDGSAGSSPNQPEPFTTQIELDDVELATLIARAEFLFGFPFPVPVSGKLSLKATATIPFDKLADLRRYAFHGDLTLKGASIDKVDIGRVSARIDLAEGVLELKDLRGRLINRPDGGPDNPPEALSQEDPEQGPIPPGGFRGTLRAELSPPGRLVARFEGNDLPLGELGAPVLPRPTPLDGLASMNIQAESDLGAARHPEAWSVSGAARSTRIRYQDAALDGVSVQFRLKDGQLDVPALAAQLDGQPLTARLNLGLKPPRAFQGVLDMTDWNLAEALALVPGTPRPAPATGTLSARAEVRGTLTPRSIQTQGEGRFGRLSAGPLTLDDVPFRWTTEGETIVLSNVEARPFGGRLTADARIPLTSGKPAEGSATLRGLDTALLSAVIPGEGVKLTGKADGQVEFRIHTDASALNVNGRLSAPGLTVQGLPAEQVHASVEAHPKALTYEVTAESLGGKIRFKGDIPLGGKVVVNGQLQAVGFALSPAWRALGVSGAAARLEGLGAFDANLRQVFSGDDAGFWVHGIAEFRNLGWGRNYPLGQLRGIVAKMPASWRVDPLDGDLLGGPARGVVRGTTPADGAPTAEFDFRVDRADLRRVLAFLPLLSRNVEGFGTMRLSGGLGATFQVNGEIEVPQARLFGLPVRELRVPAELVVEPATGAGSVRVRGGSTRFAGGQIRGEGSIRLGADRSFQGEVVLAAVDLESVARVLSTARRPASGRISGRISLNGPDPAEVARYRGRVVLDLDDASLLALPILSALDRFLGSASGGIFEDGDLVGTFANRQLIVENFTLQGRLAQVQATGTVGFDGQVNLVVLINTNQIIPQTGQALLMSIPGLRNVIGRSEQATLQVANFLSNRLLKVRVTGTVKNPSVALDPTIVVADTAVAFFAGVLKLPLGLLK